jgi:type VI protein secretion system component VasK
MPWWIAIGTAVIVIVAVPTYRMSRARELERALAVSRQHQAARAHRARLQEIEAIRRSTSEELLRIAAKPPKQKFVPDGIDPDGLAWMVQAITAAAREWGGR